MFGYTYKKGLSTKADQAKAAEWYEKAARAGNVDAQYNLGRHYERGLGRKQDFRQAVEQGHQRAIYMGRLYKQGTGVKQDDKQALEWFTRTGEHGHAGAIFQVAVFYINGRGVKQNVIYGYFYAAMAREMGYQRAEDLIVFLEKNLSQEQLETAHKVTQKSYRHCARRKKFDRYFC